MTTGAIVFMVLCLSGYALSFAFCTSKVLKNGK
jgi:hypothetical protein